MIKLTGHEKVDAIAQINFSGDITPRSWYKHICYRTSKGEGQKVDRLAIDILADIIYWYRPYEKRDEISGEFIGWRKKFGEPLLRRSPDAFAEALNATVRCVRESIKLLEYLGLITVILAPVKTKYGTLPNVMHIDINPEAITAITYNVEHKDPETIEKSLLTKWVTSNDEMGNIQLRNEEQAATKSVTSDYEIGNLSIYRDFLENSQETTQQNTFAPQAEVVPMTSGFTDERVAPETLASLNNKPESTQETDDPSSSQIIPAGENRSQIKKSQMTADFFEPLRSLYNQKKPKAWATCESINKTRLAAFKALYEEWGDRTIEALEDALLFINQDKWWRETCSARAIDTLLRRGRVTEFRDKFKASKPVVAPVRNEETGYVSTGATAEAIAAIADDEMFQQLFMKKAQ